MSRTTFSITAVLLAFAMAASAEAAGQIPPAVDVKGGYSSEGMYGGQEFHPVGWSPKGLFAYFIVQPVEGRGGATWTFRVFDTVEDQVVAELNDDTELHKDPWAVNAAAWKALLKKHGIQEGKGISFATFPLKTSGDELEARVKPTLNPNPETGMDKVTGYSVEMISREKGHKTATSRQKLKLMNVWLAGYFSNPFENRIVLVIGEEKYVSEGTEAFYTLSGCKLDSGFTK